MKMRVKMKLRFQDLKSWDEIGIEMDKDRTTVAKELRRYLRDSQNSPNSHQNMK